MSTKQVLTILKTEAMINFSMTLGAPTGKDAGVLGLWVFQ